MNKYKCEDMLNKIQKQIKDIPQGTDWMANRYDTDNELVLCVYHGDVTFDIRIPKRCFVSEALPIKAGSLRQRSI